ncbi:MAG: hypothetical protein Q4C77_11000 [Eubacteriales bacterium]|nr:hypothetical protein [Eubacteriales bacterium]
MENSEVKKQWHGPFCSAVRLELVENKGDVDFQREYNLNSKPLQIDLLVIKKTEDVSINNEIGKIFRGHNIMEYKSPGDALNVDTYYKVLGYACFYKSNGETLDCIKENDVTLSFVREEYPRELMKYFRQKGFIIEEEYPGIYYVTKAGFFPAQVIVSGKLNKDLHIWLMALTRNMEKSTAETLVYKIQNLTEKDDKINASAVLNLAMNANEKVFDKIKEDEPMFEELRKLMKPEIDAEVTAAVKEAVNAAVSAAVEENTETVQVNAVDRIVEKMGISLDNACETLGLTVEKYKEIKAKKNLQE